MSLSTRILGRHIKDEDLGDFLINHLIDAEVKTEPIEVDACPDCGTKCATCEAKQQTKIVIAWKLKPFVQPVNKVDMSGKVDGKDPLVALRAIDWQDWFGEADGFLIRAEEKGHVYKFSTEQDGDRADDCNFIIAGRWRGTDNSGTESGIKFAELEARAANYCKDMKKLGLEKYAEPSLYVLRKT